MKKILLILFILTAMTGCGSKNNLQKEYTIEEFFVIHNGIQEDFKKATEYWTDEEKEEKGHDKYIEVAKEHGIPENFEVTISGCLDKPFCTNGIIALTTTEKTDEYTGLLLCMVNDSRFITLADRDVVKIKGIYLSENRPSYLNDCTILLPTLNDTVPEFENNVKELCTKDSLESYEQLSGTISLIRKIEDFSPTDELKACDNYDLFSINFDYADYLCMVDDEEGKYSIMVFLSGAEKTDNFQVGNKIILYGQPEPSLKLDNQILYFHNSYLYYIFAK